MTNDPYVDLAERYDRMRLMSPDRDEFFRTLFEKHFDIVLYWERWTFKGLRQFEEKLQWEDDLLSRFHKLYFDGN